MRATLLLGRRSVPEVTATLTAVLHGVAAPSAETRAQLGALDPAALPAAEQAWLPDAWFVPLRVNS